MKRVVVICVLLGLLAVGCTAAQKKTGARVADGIGTSAKVVATVLAKTPAAPIAPILLLFGVCATAVGRLLRNEVKETEEEVAEKNVVVAPGFFGSRKNKLTAIGMVLGGLLIFAQLQWNLPVSVVSAGLGLIAVVCGFNIKGISDEDSAMKGNPNNGK